MRGKVLSIICTFIASKKVVIRHPCRKMALAVVLPRVVFLKTALPLIPLLTPPAFLSFHSHFNSHTFLPVYPTMIVFFSLHLQFFFACLTFSFGSSNDNRTQMPRTLRTFRRKGGEGDLKSVILDRSFFVGVEVKEGKRKREREGTNIFLYSSLHTSRLGLTALILKNCHPAKLRPFCVLIPRGKISSLSSSNFFFVVFRSTEKRFFKAVFIQWLNVIFLINAEQWFVARKSFLRLQCKWFQ